MLQGQTAALQPAVTTPLPANIEVTCFQSGDAGRAGGLSRGQENNRGFLRKEQEENGSTKVKGGDARANICQRAQHPPAASKQTGSCSRRCG